MNLYTIVIKDCDVPDIGAIHEMLVRRQEHLNKDLLHEIVNKCMEYGETVSKHHHVLALIYRNGAIIMSVAYASRQHYYPENRIEYYCDLLRFNQETMNINRWTLRKGVWPNDTCIHLYLCRRCVAGLGIYQDRGGDRQLKRH